MLRVNEKYRFKETEGAPKHYPAFDNKIVEIYSLHFIRRGVMVAVFGTSLSCITAMVITYATASFFTPHTRPELKLIKS